MNLWKRIKNVFTDQLVDVKGLAELMTRRTNDNSVTHPYAIDWDFLGIPFSVERMFSNDEEPKLITAIGYYPLINPTNVPSEWYLPLNEDQHNEVVGSFKRWKENQDVDSLLERVVGVKRD